MIAYNKTLLDNFYLNEEVRVLKKAGFINPEQQNTFEKKHPQLKTQNNIFMRIGLFILGLFLYSSICGMLSLLVLGNSENEYLYFIYFFALIGFATKEYMSKALLYFGYGLDDAFILGAISALLIAVGLTFEKNYDTNYLAILVVMTIISSVTYLRYLNITLALLACIGITATLAYSVFNYLIIGKTILPFVFLLYSGIFYFLAKKALQNLTLPYYYQGLKLAQGFCLILFYLAGNYYVVRELNASLSESYFEGGSPEIPFALLFWAFTIITPIAYLFFSLKNKDRMMLWIGFLAFCFSIFSFRIYHHILPTEVALSIGGLLLFAFTYFAIKKTKYKETGITFKVDRFTNPDAFANLQIIVSASQLGIKPEVKVEDSPIEFGGGGFSGGGSNGEF